MKLPLFASCVLATVLAAAPVFAQTEVPAAQVERNLKVREPVEVPAPSATPTPQEPQDAATEASQSPRAQVEAFFRLLTEGRVDSAYDQLLKGTKIAEMPKDVMTLKAKTREAMRAFGDINGFELVEEKKIGSNGLHLRCLTCISLGKQFPIRWRFFFYNTSSALVGPWKLIDIRIDDRLMDMFEEPTPAAEPTPTPIRRRAVQAQ